VVTLRRPLTLGLPWLLVIMESVYVMTGDLTLWNASSGPHILQITLWAVLLFPPLIILYTRWVYRVMRGGRAHSRPGQVAVLNRSERVDVVLHMRVPATPVAD
jgi:hypothetical protein